MEKNDQIPQYGDPKYIFTLGWHNEKERDYLVVVDYKKKDEVMAARAKGTTIYELIDIYGGVDEVSVAFSNKQNAAVYGDVSNLPEFANDESYNNLVEQIKTLTKQIEDMKPKQIDEPAVKGGAEEK